MKRIVVSFILAFCVNITFWAQQKVHTVMRGETFAIIAKKYGISEEELRNANTTVKMAHTGAKLKIPQKKVERAVSTPTPPPKNNASSMSQSPSIHTSQMHQSQTSASITPNTNWHSREKFNSGKKNFYDKKWKKAIADFNEVLSDPLATEEEIRLSKQFVAQAKEKQKEKEERRQEFANRLTKFGDKLQELGQQMQNAQIARYGNAYSYGNTRQNVRASTKKNPPQFLDAAHKKEFLEKGRTSYVVSQNAQGKRVRQVEICMICQGNDKRCPYCRGTGRDQITGMCYYCAGTGKEYCHMCHDTGWTQKDFDYDGRGNLIAINGKSVEQIEAEANRTNYTGGGLGGGYTGGSQPQKCRLCLGTGKIPYIYYRGRLTPNTSGGKCIGSDHVCKLVGNCNTCGRNHCVYQGHISCESCHGTGGN